MLGSLLGVLPGGGALLAAFGAYTLEKKVAKPPRHFGDGDIRGVAAPESANNAGAQTSFIPMLTLGIPSNPTMAMMIGALMIHGISPGPRVMTDRPELFWGLIVSMWIGNLMLVVLNLPLVGMWVKLLRIPYRLLFPAIVAFLLHRRLHDQQQRAIDLFVMAFFAVFGYLCLKLDCEPAPLILGFVLGPMMEENLRRSLLISRGDPMVFLQEPISLAFLIDLRAAAAGCGRAGDPEKTRGGVARMTIVMNRLLTAVLIAAGGFAVSTAEAPAQSWPDKPVKIIVPFGAGGSGDTLARVVAEHLSATFKQQFVVENRTGAGGMIGTQAIAATPPDGYTIGITNLSTLALVPAINPSATYHPVNDFTHIAYVAGAPVALAATPSSGIKTLKEFIDAANKAASPLTFASSGVGSDGHLVGVAIALALNVKLEHVPYRSTSQALTDVVAGHVALCTFTLSSTAAFLRGGQLNGVAVTSPDRMPDQPDLPTFKELGYPQLVGTTWFSLSGPAKFPADAAAKINAEVNKMSSCRMCRHASAVTVSSPSQ